MILTSGVLGLSLGKFDDYGAFLFLNNSGGATTAYVTSGVGGSGVPLFAERSASQLITYTGGLSTPPASFGFSGDYAVIPTGNYRFFGPKPSDTGAWGLGMDLIISGATGLMGPIGPTGAPGTGLISGGASGTILAKKSVTNQDTEWVDVVDILAKTKINEYANYKGVAGTKTFQVKSEDGTLLSLHNITHSEFSSSFYIVGSDSYIRCYSSSFNFLYKVDASSFVDGQIGGISWVKGNEFLITTNDFSSSSKIHKIKVDSSSVTSVESFNTGLPVSVYINSICYDERNDIIYFSQKYSYSGVWLLRKITGYDSLSGPIETVFDFQTSDLNGGAYGTMTIDDIHYNKSKNTIVCLTQGGGSTWLYEIDVKTSTPVNDKQEGVSVNGLSFIDADTAVFADGFNMGFCFRDNDNHLYLIAEDGYSSAAVFSKNGLSNIFCDQAYDNKSYVCNNSSVFSPIEVKQFQSYNYTNKTLGSSFYWDGSRNFGARGCGRVSEGTEVSIKAFGKISTSKQTSIFPTNYGYQYSSITSSAYAYLTGSYYLQVPSGLSGVNWSHSTDIIFGEMLSGGTQIEKQIQSRFELFTNPKLELYYIETGVTYINVNSDVGMSVLVAPSGSGNMTLFNQRVLVR